MIWTSVFYFVLAAIGVDVAMELSTLFNPQLDWAWDPVALGWRLLLFGWAGWFVGRLEWNHKERTYEDYQRSLDQQDS